jgi:heme/copper-type cytochrome/quinol oxidase subunit 3|tara:strand:+ start:2311 stop:2508 length:198 start_codon:yes stop_codon:yes gene_type:complete
MIYILSALIFFLTFIASYKYFNYLKRKYLKNIKDENLYMAFGFLALILTSGLSLATSSLFLILLI